MTSTSVTRNPSRALSAMEGGGTGARHVADRLAPPADKVVVVLGDVGVIALRALGDLNEAELAHRHELVQRVVDGRPADLRESLLGEVVNLLGSEMDVLTYEHLGNGSPLCAHAPITVAQSRQQVCSPTSD